MAIAYPTVDKFDALLQDNEMVLVDFWATWCAPCKMIAPVVEQLAEEYADQLVVAKIDIDENQRLAAKYLIQTVPTLMLFKKGEPVAMEIGTQSLEKLRSMIGAQL